MWLAIPYWTAQVMIYSGHTHGADGQELPEDCLAQPLWEIPLARSQIGRYLIFLE